MKESEGVTREKGAIEAEVGVGHGKEEPGRNIDLLAVAAAAGQEENSTARGRLAMTVVNQIVGGKSELTDGFLLSCIWQRRYESVNCIPSTPFLGYSKCVPA